MVKPCLQQALCLTICVASTQSLALLHETQFEELEHFRTCRVIMTCFMAILVFDFKFSCFLGGAYTHCSYPYNHILLPIPRAKSEITRVNMIIYNYETL